jgi:hypothetical protein
MTGMRTLEENIQRLEDAIERAALASREANSATKAANKAQKALEATLRSVPRLVDESIGEEIRKGLEDYQDSLKEHTTSSHDHIIQEFDKLKNIMLYGNERGKGENLVEEWIRNMVRKEILEMNL